MYTSQVKGVTLLHVMVLLTMLSIILMSELKNKGQKEDIRKFEYTVAQTDVVLNLAYAYFRKKGRWPGTGTDCENFSEHLTGEAKNKTMNGWGVELSCKYAGGTTANNANEFLLRQYVPTHFGTLYQTRFRSNEIALDTAATAHSGFVAYTVSVNRSGGADQMLESIKLSSYASSPATLPKMDCPSGTTAKGFMALSGMEAHVNKQQMMLYKNSSGNCFNSILFKPSPVRMGYRYVMADKPSVGYELTYNMYRKAENSGASSPPYDFDDGKVITDEILDGGIDTGCNSYPTIADANDGHYNAKEEADSEDIQVASFQFCQPGP